MSKKRIDLLLVERQLVKSLDEAHALVLARKVLVNQEPVMTVGTLVSCEAQINLTKARPYVSRGGYKLAYAVEYFDVDIQNKICADIGASTGGFTDVLLQWNAKRIYAVDVGYGDLAWKLRQNPKVVIMERTNAKFLTTLPEAVSIVTIDVSFISVKSILATSLHWVDKQADFIVLVKPQFEADRKMVERGGVVRKISTYIDILFDITDWSMNKQFRLRDLAVSPILGRAGNREFLLHLMIGQSLEEPDPKQLVESCLQSLS